MQIEIKIDKTLTEPKVVIFTDKVADEVNAIIKKISIDDDFILTGFRDDKFEILEKEDIVRIYAVDKKTVAVTQKGDYIIRLRLYELEEKLRGQSFVRISNSEIINLKKAKNFDVSFVGTICVLLLNGTVTYVSRRYVKRIKQLLGI